MVRLHGQEREWSYLSRVQRVPSPAVHTAGLGRAGQGAWLCLGIPERRWDSTRGLWLQGLLAELGSLLQGARRTLLWVWLFLVQPFVGVSGFSCSHTALQCWVLVSREAGLCGVATEMLPVE